jgi:acyl carrier protein
MTSARGADLSMRVKGRALSAVSVERTAAEVDPSLRPEACAAFSVNFGDGDVLVVLAEVERRPGAARKKPAGGKRAAPAEPALPPAEPAAVLKRIREAVQRACEVPVHWVALVQPGTLGGGAHPQREACRRAFLERKLEVVAESSLAPDIQAWIVANLARLRGLDPRQLDVRQPFARFGVVSLDAMTLSAELGEWLGRQLPATLIWDWPTIEALARHLAEDRNV